MSKVLLLLGCVFVATSCGGGGSSDPVHPATVYRANAVGDSSEYQVAINFGIFGSDTGTLTNALTADSYGGQSTIRDTQTFTIDYPAGPHSTVSYSEISASGGLLATTSNGVLYNVTSNTFSTGNTIDATTSTSGVLTLSNGVTLTETYKVIGAENCVTPSGTYACWVVSQKVVSSTGTTDNFKIWVAPETGGYVKLQDTTRNPDGTGYTYTASLVLATVNLNRTNTPFPIFNRSWLIPYLATR